MFNGERSFKIVEKLAVEIGSRPGGTKADREAAMWIASEFEALGLKTTIEEFDVTTGKVVSKKLEVLEPYKEEVNCEVWPRHGSTGPEGVIGDLIHLESLDEEYLVPEITGKIILTFSRHKNPKKTYSILSKLKPLAIIFVEVSHQVLPMRHWGNVNIKEKFGELPVVHITYEDCLKLLEKGARRVHLVAEAEVWKAKSQNVIGELEGGEKPSEIVLIGGHYDSVWGTPGAQDDAGGVAVVMELARVFSEKGTKRTMRFIAWGCEELGLLGARDYASKLREASENAGKEKDDEETELEMVKLCLNLDDLGAFPGWNASCVLGPPELRMSLELLSKEAGMTFNIWEGPYGSDGVCLSYVGVPSLSFSRGSPAYFYIHTPQDNIRWMKPKALQIQGEFIELFLTRYVAEAAVFPFERVITEEQKKEMENWFKMRLLLDPEHEHLVD